VTTPNEDRAQLQALAALQPEPPPTPGTGDLWLDVIARTTDPVLRELYVARRAQGLARYGVPLQRDNGRDHLVDALQEAVDLVVYLEAAEQRELQAEAEELARGVWDVLASRAVPYAAVTPAARRAAATRRRAANLEAALERAEGAAVDARRELRAERIRERKAVAVFIHREAERLKALNLANAIAVAALADAIEAGVHRLGGDL
jgi:hypothetical protein